MQRIRDKRGIDNMAEDTLFRNHREITCWENRARLKFLRELQYHILKYFENTNYNMLSGDNL